MYKTFLYSNCWYVNCCIGVENAEEQKNYGGWWLLRCQVDVDEVGLAARGTVHFQDRCFKGCGRSYGCNGGRGMAPPPRTCLGRFVNLIRLIDLLREACCTRPLLPGTRDHECVTRPHALRSRWLRLGTPLAACCVGCCFGHSARHHPITH